VLRICGDGDSDGDGNRILHWAQNRKAFWRIIPKRFFLSVLQYPADGIVDAS